MPTWLTRLMLIGTVSILPTARSFATRDDFLKETLVYRTLHRGELEPEYWLDISLGSLGRERRFGHSLALEYGITEQWMMDARGTFRSGKTRSFSLESGRLELRYRLPQDKSLPADIALSAEVNTERTDQGEYEVGIEPRIIFSREFGRLDATVNLSAEIGLESGKPEFNPSCGVRYSLPFIIHLGLEARYNTTTKNGELIPQVFVNLSEDVTVKLGIGHRFGVNHVDAARLAIEVDL